jgi:hypothetical protein
MSKQLKFAPRVAALAAAAALAGPAAAITCRDGTQDVKGTWMVTPYCQDAYLAEVAREYGFPASAEKIRNNKRSCAASCSPTFAWRIPASMRASPSTGRK